jgi:hypothetical protein
MFNAFVAKAAGADAVWIAFQAWAVYFLAGCTIKGGIKAWIGYATGVAASIAIIELMGAPGIKSLPQVGGMNLGMAVAVFIVVVPAIMSENLKNMVPALFIGSGAFFGLTGLMAGADGPNWESHIAVTRAELVYCAFGLLFGYITVFWRGKYEASLIKKT